MSLVGNTNSRGEVQGNVSAPEKMNGNISMPKFIQGKSAYEIAVMNGFDGTEAEWLESLTENTRKNAQEVIEEADNKINELERAEAEAVQHITDMGEQALSIVQTIGGGETSVMSQKAVTNELYTEMPLEWELGAIDGTTGQGYDNNGVCRVKGYFDVRTIHSVSVIKKKQIFVYDKTYKYIKTSAIAANSTLTQADILAMGDVAYFRLRSDWSETPSTVDKVTVYENKNLKNAIELSEAVDAKYEAYTIKKHPMNWGRFYYKPATGLCDVKTTAYVSGDRIRLAEFVKAVTGNNLYFRVYVFGENNTYLGYLDNMRKGGTLIPEDIYATYPNASEIILSMYYGNNAETPVADVEQYTTVYCSAAEAERAENWHKHRQRFNDKPIMVAYSNGGGLGHTNTELAYINAAIAGFRWIKGDVQPTSDGKLVMCHDEGFTFDANNRITTYGASGGQTRSIYSMTYAECMGCEYARSYALDSNVTYRPKVCDLEQFLVVCKEYEVRPYIVIREEHMDVVVPELLRLLEAYDFTDNCIVNSFEIDSVKQVAEQSNHRVMISVVKNYAKGSKLTPSEIDELLAVSPNCTINAYTSTSTDWNNVLLMEASSVAIEYAKHMGVVVGTAFVENPHPLFKKGVGLMQCSTPCIPTKTTSVKLCVSMLNGVAKIIQYGGYSGHTADVEVSGSHIFLRNIRVVDSTRDFPDGITPNLAAIHPYSLGASGNNVKEAKLYWHNKIGIELDTNFTSIDTSTEKTIYVKFTYGI